MSEHSGNMVIYGAYIALSCVFIIFLVSCASGVVDTLRPDSRKQIMAFISPINDRN